MFKPLFVSVTKKLVTNGVIIKGVYCNSKIYDRDATTTKNQGSLSSLWVCTKCPSNLVGVINVELIMPRPWLLGVVSFWKVFAWMID
jgi:hypothetical protein